MRRRRGAVRVRGLQVSCVGDMERPRLPEGMNEHTEPLSMEDLRGSAGASASRAVEQRPALELAASLAGTRRALDEVNLQLNTAKAENQVLRSERAILERKLGQAQERVRELERIIEGGSIAGGVGAHGAVADPHSMARPAAPGPAAATAGASSATSVRRGEAAALDAVGRAEAQNGELEQAGAGDTGGGRCARSASVSEATIAGLKAELDAMHTEAARLVFRNEDLERRLGESMRASIADHQARRRIEQLETELRGCKQKQLAEHSIEVNGLQRALSEATTRSEEILREHQQINDNIRAQLQEHRGRAAGLEDELRLQQRAALAREGELEDKIAELSSRLSLINARTEQEAATARELQSQRLAAMDRECDLKAQNGALVDKVSLLQVRLDAAERAQNSASEVAEMKAQASATRDAWLEAQIRSHLSSLSDLTIELDRHRALARDLSFCNIEAMHSMHELREAIADHVARHPARSSKTHECFSADVEKIKNEIGNLKQTQCSGGDAWRLLKQHLQAMLLFMADLDSQVRELELQLQQVQSEKHDAEHRVQMHYETIQTLTVQLIRFQLLERTFEI